MRAAVWLLSLCLIVSGGAAMAADMAAVAVSHGPGGREHRVTVRCKDNNLRLEPAGSAGYTIIRRDQNLVYEVMPPRRLYVARPLTPGDSLPTGRRLPGELGRRTVGREVVAGRDCRVDEVEVMRAGRRLKLRVWLDPALPLPVRLEAANGAFGTTLEEIDASPQDAALFEPPEGFQRLDAAR